MRDDGQEAVHAEIVVDEKAAGRALPRQDADIALRLRRVEHMDHGQHRRPQALEQFSEIVPVHGVPELRPCTDFGNL